MSSTAKNFLIFFSGLFFLSPAMNQAIAQEASEVEGQKTSETIKVGDANIVGGFWGQWLEVSRFDFTDHKDDPEQSDSCRQVPNFLWNWQMLLAEGNAAFADRMEVIMYNSLLVGKMMDGGDRFSKNPLLWCEEEQQQMQQQMQRQMYQQMQHQSLLQNVAEVRQDSAAISRKEIVDHYATYLYSAGENTLWIHHYADNGMITEIPGYGTLGLNLVTEYPLDGNVQLEITEAGWPRKLTLNVRIPEWAKGARITLNDEPVKPVEAGTYVTIEKVFRKGDRVMIDLPMEVQLYRANPKFEHLINKVAVKRGPLLYCMESIDMPLDVDMDDVLISARSGWKIKSSPNLLNDIPVLEATGALIRSDMADQPYAPVGAYQIEPVRVRMIPYLGWNNRGDSNIKVWLPVIW